ncbi:DUF1353 domain-containing protein [Nocardia uniformis]|uniref:DUF1353 domain-containing protein n=1 Tax=Nocardia uniformis TaxID=53432 RepID=A0A849BUX1_9NOCA|nr:DUF1353 domain-containing protein [Nocardia uniformis]NNH68858.1 DUF1353 domain-containing protein [Nocardia uniformis]
MKLQVEQDDGPFYDGGEAPAEEAAAAIAPEAVVVNVAEPPESPRTRADDQDVADDLEPDLVIVLDRRFNEATRREEFRLLRRIGYDDNVPGVGIGRILVPADLENWTTDLTSVPFFLTWLVPKTGAHLPAAILHDGLVLHKDEPASYIAAREIYRDEADRVFRDAMAKTGTGLLRRWMVWAAVTAATMHFARQVDWAPIQKWHYRIALWGTLALIVSLGMWSTLDLLNISGIAGVPWIGERPIPALIGGLAGALAIPLLLGTTWGKFRIAGWIIGPLVALILPAIVPIVVISGLYVGVERLQQWQPWLAKALAVVSVCAILAVFAVSWWMA